jgi:hypothetical protein
MLHQKQERFARKELLIRFIAALMLALFLPLGVLAGPLRYCLGHDGHRAIEFVHANNFSHVDSTVTHRPPVLDSAGIGFHIEHAHCRDTLLLPVIAKSEKRLAKSPNRDPVPGTAARFHLAAHAKWRAHGKFLVLPSRVSQTDPRLSTLRTVVLLN